MGRMWKKNSKYHKLGIESDVEIDRCHRIVPRKTKTGQNQDGSCTVV